MEQSKIFAKLFRLFSELLDRTPIAELEALIAGRAQLKIVTKPVAGAKKPISTKIEKREINLAEISNRLQSFSSRDEGYKLLEDENLTKKQLEDLARLLLLPVNKQDNIERLEDKIIEFCIGSRLNSEAIRGTSGSDNSQR